MATGNSRNRKKKAKLSKLKIAGCILAAIEFIISVFFIYFAISTKVVPMKYALLAGVVLGIFPILVVLMQMNKKTGVVGIVLAVIISAVVGYGIYLVRHADKALDKVTGKTTEITVMNVYIKKDDPVNSINDAIAQGYKFGILREKDRDKADETIKQIEASVSGTVQTSEYETIFDIAKAMNESAIQGFITSSAFVSALDGSEEYHNYSDGLKIILEKQIETEVEVKAEDEKKKPEAPKAAGCFAVYISGIDTFGSVSAKSRSDVNILAIVNRNTRQIMLLTTPRDFYVPLSISDGYKDKLTHAGIYGIDVSMDTLEMIYDVNIDYYVRLNFTGFINIIDALGGIDVYSQYSFGTPMETDYFTYEKGMNHLYGKAALAFARERHSFGDGDFQRGRNQMEVIKGIIAGLESSQLLYNFADVMEELSNTFETNMTKDEVGELVQEMIDSDRGWNVLSYEVMGYPDWGVCYTGGGEASVVTPEWRCVDYANELIHRTLDGETMTQDEVKENAPKGNF